MDRNNKRKANQEKQGKKTEFYFPSQRLAQQAACGYMKRITCGRRRISDSLTTVSDVYQRLRVMALYKCDYDYDDYDIATPFFDAVKLEAFCYLQHKHSKIT